jgi:uncharacterized membrane protein
VPILAASAYEVVLAFHVMAVVIAFGWTFALPFFYVIAAKRDPRSLPVLHTVELMITRYLLYPALLVIIAAGIFLASDGHHWSEFFVQWGLAVAIVIGALVGAVLTPAARRAEQAVRRDLEGFQGGDFEPGEEYTELTQRLNLVGSLASSLVLLTIFFMVIKP